MHIEFTDKELEAIERVPFAWRVKKGSDPVVAESARRKIRMLKNQSVGPMRKGGNGSQRP